MSQLTTEQQQFIEHNRPHYNTLVKADFLTNLDQRTKEGMLEVAKVFSPGMVANLWCGPCVCDLVKYVYTQVDKMPKEPEIKLIEKDGVTYVYDVNDIHPATFPKQDEPKVKRPYNRKKA